MEYLLTIWREGDGVVAAKISWDNTFITGYGATAAEAVNDAVRLCGSELEPN